MSEELDYFGVRPCGCVTAWLSVKYATKAEVRKFYREMADTGREIRRAPLDGPAGWRDRLVFECPHKEEVAVDVA